MRAFRWLWGSEPRQRVLTFAVCSLIGNLIYAFYNGVLGILNLSVWFGATCVYYLLLSLMRFLAVVDSRERWGVLLAAGALLALMSLVLGQILYISLREDRAVAYGTIPMIAVATYTFTKIGLAIRRAVRGRGDPSLRLRTIRVIGYAEVAVSVATMQRSMLASFEGMDTPEIQLMNGLTGTAVCLFTLVLGLLQIRLIRKEAKT